MQQPIIRITYRQVLNNESTTIFAKAVLTKSYREFLLKVQAYNPGSTFTTFKEIVAADGRAHSLHYKASFPVIPFIERLQNIIPGITDNAGNDIHFETFDFTLIDSSIIDAALHTVAITYITHALILIDRFGDHLLVKRETPMNEHDRNEPFIIRIQPGISINHYAYS